MPAHAAQSKRAWLVPGIIGAVFVLLGAGVLGVAIVGNGGGQETSATGTTSGDDPTPTEATTTTTAPPPPPPPPPMFPLTGLPAPDAGAAARPAIVAKFDNAEPKSRPQAGLNQADVVYEETVEGSVTRLAAVFQSTDADPIGPVRSARTTDVGIAVPLNSPLFVWSGANADFAAIIRSSAMADLGHGAVPDAYYRRGDRAAPSNLFTSTPLIYSLTPPDAGTPPPLFSFRGPGAPLAPGAYPVNSVNIVFGPGIGSAPVDYYWDPAIGGYARFQEGTPHVDEAGVQVAPQNVIVQIVDYVDTGYVDVGGSPVPEAALVGEGSAWILTAGHLIDARWVKPAPEAVTQYYDAAGAPVGLSPGRTWVALVPPGGATTG